MFSENLYSWQEFYTTACRTGRAKYQLCRVNTTRVFFSLAFGFCSRKKTTFVWLLHGLTCASIYIIYLVIGWFPCFCRGKQYMKRSQLITKDPRSIVAVPVNHAKASYHLTVSSWISGFSSTLPFKEFWKSSFISVWFSLHRKKLSILSDEQASLCIMFQCTDCSAFFKKRKILTRFTIIIQYDNDQILCFALQLINNSKASSKRNMQETIQMPWLPKEL